MSAVLPRAGGTDAGSLSPIRRVAGGGPHRAGNAPHGSRHPAPPAPARRPLAADGCPWKPFRSRGGAVATPGGTLATGRAALRGSGPVIPTDRHHARPGALGATVRPGRCCEATGPRDSRSGGAGNAIALRGVGRHCWGPRGPRLRGPPPHVAASSSALRPNTAGDRSRSKGDGQRGSVRAQTDSIGWAHRTDATRLATADRHAPRPLRIL
jgi:hypothetical protein